MAVGGGGGGNGRIRVLLGTLKVLFFRLASLLLLVVVAFVMGFRV